MQIDLSTGLESESKKKKGSSRSRMLKMIMPMLSGENGDKLGAAISDNDPDAARRVMEKISKELQLNLKKKKG